MALSNCCDGRGQVLCAAVGSGPGFLGCQRAGSQGKASKKQANKRRALTCVCGAARLGAWAAEVAFATETLWVKRFFVMLPACRAPGRSQNPTQCKHQTIHKDLLQNCPLPGRTRTFGAADQTKGGPSQNEGRDAQGVCMPTWFQSFAVRPLLMRKRQKLVDSCAHRTRGALAT